MDVLCTLTFNLHQRLLNNESELGGGIWYELKELLITAKQTSMVSSSTADVSSVRKMGWCAKPLASFPNSITFY